MEAGFDLLAEEAQRVDDAVLRDFAAAIQLGEDAVKADLLLDLTQSRGKTIRVIDEELCREGFVIGQRFEPLDLAQPLCGQLPAGAARRVAPELRLVAEEAHDACLGFGSRRLA